MVAYFEFVQESPEGETNRFIFKLEESAKIAEAREIIKSNGPKSHIQGTIIPQRVPYNPKWSFHLAPKSIGFFEMQTEVCDSNVTYVEEHLDEIGGSTLPRSFWCPWSSKLSSEATDRVDPKTEELRP
jgi:hypothetical protein